MKKVRMLSLGAGVQSSAVLLMADRGDIPPLDFAVFADTQSEPQEVYDWLEKLKTKSKTLIYTATRSNLAQDTIDYFQGTLKRVGQPPLYARKILNDGTIEKGMLRRHCTKEYKIDVVDKKIRDILGYKFRQRMRHKIEVVMGISYDEEERMRVSTKKWKSFNYPLVSMKKTRGWCIDFVEGIMGQRPPRSACFFCPFKSNEEWRLLKTNPVEWGKAVDFDKKIRHSVNPGLTSEFFIHRQCVPLDEADLIEKDDSNKQMTFRGECFGVCGV